MKTYVDEMRKETQLRKERLKTITELVRKGEYRIDPLKVAEKIIEDALHQTLY